MVQLRWSYLCLLASAYGCGRTAMITCASNAMDVNCAAVAAAGVGATTRRAVATRIPAGPAAGQEPPAPMRTVDLAAPEAKSA